MASRRCRRSSTWPRVHEAIAAAVPDRECLVWRDRRLTWADVTDRSRRFAAVLAGRGSRLAPPARPTCAGLGVAPRPRRALPPQRQRVPRGAARCRQGARGRASTSTTATSPRSSATSSSTAAPGRSCTTAPSPPRCSEVLPLARRSAPLLLQVDDDSEHPAPPRRASEYEAALAGADPRPPERPQPGRPLHPLHRAAPPGMPKGVLWRQADFLAACLGIRETTDAARRGRPALEPARPPRRPVHARRRPLERAVRVDERGHGGGAGPPGAARSPRRARHGRAGAGDVAPDRGRRLRPTARRRARERATTTPPACGTSSPAAPRCRPT